MCTVLLLPGVNPIAVNKYSISYESNLDQDVERDLATNIQPPEHLKAFTLKELKNEIQMLHLRRAPALTSSLHKC